MFNEYPKYFSRRTYRHNFITDFPFAESYLEVAVSTVPVS